MDAVGRTDCHTKDGGCVAPPQAQAFANLYMLRGPRAEGVRCPGQTLFWFMGGRVQIAQHMQAMELHALHPRWIGPRVAVNRYGCRWQPAEGMTEIRPFQLSGYGRTGAGSWAVGSGTLHGHRQ